MLLTCYPNTPEYSPHIHSIEQRLPENQAKEKALSYQYQVSAYLSKTLLLRGWNFQSEEEEVGGGGFKPRME